MPDSRTLAGSALADALRDSRARTLRWAFDLSDEQWLVPEQSSVNPLAWELAHLAWFAEFWVLRGPHRRSPQGWAEASESPRHAGPDEHFDSARLSHGLRWRTPMPSRERVAGMLAAQLDACIGAIPDVDGAAGDVADPALYFHRLALLHEDMHGEAFAWLRSALGYPAPAGLEPPAAAQASALNVSGGELVLGRPDGQHGFAFDNERPACPVRLRDFEIDTCPVSAGRFLEFVEAGGYDRPECWPGVAGRWRESARRRHPHRWRRSAAGAWETRWFDRWLPLAPEAPVMHVNAFEAEAYCHWARRRLPSAAEWEHAAARIRWGHSVWEWTASSFDAYPGFVAGPYMEYSAPWFGNHRELRGGAFATHTRLHDRRYRNFFLPQRSDIFAGFRTAAR